MPYCSKCGAQVADTDVYCGECGEQQPQPAGSPMQPLGNLSSRNASLLCYVPLIGWIAAIVVLASNRFKMDRTVRFHAFQGLYLFVAWLIVDWAVGPFFHAAGRDFEFSVAAVLKGALIAIWIFMLIKTSQNEHFRLPVLGELAERSVAEQQ